MGPWRHSQPGRPGVALLLVKSDRQTRFSEFVISAPYPGGKRPTSVRMVTVTGLPILVSRSYIWSFKEIPMHWGLNRLSIGKGLVSELRISSRQPHCSPLKLLMRSAPVSGRNQASSTSVCLWRKPQICTCWRQLAGLGLLHHSFAASECIREADSVYFVGSQCHQKGTCFSLRREKGLILSTLQY